MFLYRYVSDEIGEAWVCWGTDILVLEQKAGDLLKKSVYAPVVTPPRAIGRHSTVSRWWLPVTLHFLNLRLYGIVEFESHVCLCLDVVRSALRQEREGAISVKAVMELRRNEGLLEEEEVE